MWETWGAFETTLSQEGDRKSGSVLAGVPAKRAQCYDEPLPKRRRYDDNTVHNTDEDWLSDQEGTTDRKSGSVPAVVPATRAQCDNDNTVHNTDEDWIMKALPVDELLYTQYSMSSHFRDGSSVKRLIEELNARKFDTMKKDFLCLDGYEIDGRVYATDNRRLYALKAHQEFQREKGSSRQVRIKVRVRLVTNEFWKRILSRGLYDHGRNINIRKRA